MWQSLVTIGQATSEITAVKIKKDLNDSGNTEWPAAWLASQASIIKTALKLALTTTLAPLHTSWQYTTVFNNATVYRTVALQTAIYRLLWYTVQQLTLDFNLDYF